MRNPWHANCYSLTFGPRGSCRIPPPSVQKCSRDPGKDRALRQARVIRPQYVDRFRCVAGKCEDSCCAGWAVPIDQQTYEKYQQIPAGALRTLIDEHLIRTPDHRDGAAPDSYASMRLLPSRVCPMHNADKLCRIQLERGESYLSQTCSTFPRYAFRFDNLPETAFTLSCPEAARIVLTNENLLGHRDRKPVYMNWDDKPPGKISPVSYFWPIREFIVTLVQNRNYALWQRLFLLGTFCRRLEKVFQENGDFSALERGFSAAVATGSLRSSIETINANHALQLNVVLGLARMRTGAESLPPRLSECWDTFMDGIGREAPFEQQCGAYAQACELYFAPFVEANPHVFENLLLNAIFRTVFPYGTEVFRSQASIRPARQYALLVTEFALIKGLLIGVAGSRKQAFSIDDVIKTVQVVSKHFEHSPSTVKCSLEMLAAERLDTAYGLTMLLRN